MKKREKQKMPRRKKVVYALLFTLLTLFGLEILLRLLGLFTPVPFFSEFIGRDGKTWVRFNRNHLQPEFLRDKPAGVFRIMIAGESTTVGFPYHPRSTFGERLGLMLEEALPGWRVEILLIGKMGIYSGEVEEMVREAVKYHPDLMIVYSGQNEFVSLPRRPPAVVMSALRALEHCRVGQLLFVIGQLFIAQPLISFLDLWENPEAGLAMPLPPLISNAEYRRAFHEYEENLKKIVADCQKAKVRLVLCTMTLNLRDWYPDFQSYPRDWTEGKKQAAWTLFEQADAMLYEHRYAEVLQMLSQKEQEFRGYAPLSFARGRARVGLLEQALAKLESENSGGKRWTPELEQLRALAISDFQEAIGEEVRLTLSHRAAPEFNSLIRKLAQEEGVMLFDPERLFLAASPLPPGFEWFEDHCHPNLAGQQLFANGLFQLLREHDLPVEKSQWREVSWNEDLFAAIYGLDNEFLRHVYQTIGIWVGLRKRLPEHCAYLRSRFRLISELKPDDPMPVILETLYNMTYADQKEPGARLANWYSSQPSLLAKCIDRYFTSALELRQGILMARINWDPDTPPLQGFLKSGMFFEDQEGKAKTVRGQKPLDYYFSFLDLEAGGRDLTALMTARLKQMKNRPRRKNEFLLAEARSGKFLLASEGVHLEQTKGGVRYYLESENAFLTTGPLKVPPLDYDLLELSFTFQGQDSGKPLTLAWTALGPGPHRQTFFAQPEAVAQEPGKYVLHLSRLPRWVLADMVVELQLFPGQRGRLELSNLRLIQLAQDE